MEMELIVAEKLDPEVIFTGKGMPDLLKQIKERVESFVFDSTTPQGRDEIKSLAYQVSRSKTLIDEMGKSKVAKQKAEIKVVDANRKMARDFLDELRDTTRQPVTAYEAEEKRKAEAAAKAEMERIATIEKAVEDIRAHGNNLGFMSSDEIKSTLTVLAAMEITEEGFQEFQATADQVRNEVYAQAEAALEKRLKLDAEAEAQKVEAERLEKVRVEQEAEAARLKAAQDEIDRKNKEAQDKLDADRKALEDEKARIAAEKQAEQDAKDRAEREAVEKAEREKKEAEARERAEALKPDKEKLIAWAKELMQITAPDLESQGACIIRANALSKIGDVSAFIEKSVDVL